MTSHDEQNCNSLNLIWQIRINEQRKYPIIWDFHILKTDRIQSYLTLSYGSVKTYSRNKALALAASSSYAAESFVRSTP